MQVYSLVLEKFEMYYVFSALPGSRSADIYMYQFKKNDAVFQIRVNTVPMRFIGKNHN